VYEKMIRKGDCIMCRDQEKEDGAGERRTEEEGERGKQREMREGVREKKSRRRKEGQEKDGKRWTVREGGGSRDRKAASCMHINGSCHTCA